MNEFDGKLKKMTIEETEQEIVEEFEMFDDWMQKYEHLIDLGKSLPVIREEDKTEDKIIKGCQSRVWLHSELRTVRLFILQTAMRSSQKEWWR